jgi:hypothetical protein
MKGLFSNLMAARKLTTVFNVLTFALVVGLTLIAEPAMAAPVADELQTATTKIWGWVTNVLLICAGIGVMYGAGRGFTTGRWEAAVNPVMMALAFGIIVVVIQASLGAPLAI